MPKICFGWVEYTLWDWLFIFQSTVIIWKIRFFSYEKNTQKSFQDIIPFSRTKKFPTKKGKRNSDLLLWSDTVLGHLTLLNTDSTFYSNSSTTHRQQLWLNSSSLEQNNKSRNSRASCLCYCLGRGMSGGILELSRNTTQGCFSSTNTVLA